MQQYWYKSLKINKLTKCKSEKRAKINYLHRKLAGRAKFAPIYLIKQ